MQIDTDGLANLFTALNAPCYCEKYPDFRKRLARDIIKHYRRLRAKGIKYKEAVFLARSYKPGIECVVGPPNRGWKTFFDASDVAKLSRRSPQLYISRDDSNYHGMDSPNKAKMRRIHLPSFRSVRPW